MPQLANGKIDRQMLASMPVVRPLKQQDPVRSADLLEEILLEIWRSVLGHEQFGFLDDFFLIGGNSLLAARVVTLVEQRTGLNVPLSDFFAEPTLSAMTESLRVRERARYDSFITLSSGGSGTPFFYLHGDVVGLGMYCRTFGSTLGLHRPIFVLSPHGNDAHPVPATIGEMASDYLSAIRAHQPHGPYVIGGYCIGALVAFELTRQIEAAGETVERLVLIEAQQLRPQSSRIYDRLARQAARIGIQEAPVRSWVAGQRVALRRVRQLVRSRGKIPMSALSHGERVNAEQHTAIMRYVWHPIAASTVMLCAREEAPDITIVEKDWQRLFTSLQVKHIPGDHATAIGPHIDDTILAIESAIATAHI